MDRIEETLRAALARAGAADPAARQAVYARARASFDRSPASSSPQSDAMRRRLEASIERVEASFSSTSVGDDPVPPRTDVSQDAVMNGQSAVPTQKSSRSVPVLAGVAVVAIAAIVGGTWYWMNQAKAVDTEFDGSGAGFAANIEGTPLDAIADGRFEIVESDGERVMRVTGSASVVAAAPLKIDTSKTYAMKLRARVTRDDPETEGATLLAGFATFDAEGKLQTDAPGTHRYFVATGKLTEADGWREFEGTITGEGNETHKTFRPGTASAKPIVLANFQSPQAVTEIDYIRFKECENPQNCSFEEEPEAGATPAE